MDSKIPKIIHLIWFGGKPYPPLVERCIESWKKYLPDYKIMKWDESNFDIHCNKYVEQAYEAKKWAFVSDYVRLWALCNYGGIYMDTDVEVLKPLDIFLSNEVFSGFESKDRVPTGIIGATKSHRVVQELLSYYDNATFILENGENNQTTNVQTITNMLLDKGLVLNGKKQTIDGFTLFPQMVFCPNNFLKIFGIPSKESYTIHHFEGSWTDHPVQEHTILLNLKRYLIGVARNVIGTDKILKIRRNK